jgi:hypothetical protein
MSLRECNIAFIVEAMPLSSPLRTIRNLLGFTLLLMVAIVGWKGFSLWALSQAMDAKLAQITDAHVELVENRISAMAPLQASLLAPEQTQALQSAAATVQKEKSDPTVESILATQGSVTSFLNTAPAEEPSVQASKEVLGKDSGMDAQFQEYNKLVQQWNNQQDTFLGQKYFTLFGLKPRLLLNTDGRKEFQTTVTL